EHIEFQASEAEVRVRLLPVTGAAFAADWAARHLAELKRNSVSYSFQSEQGLQDLQDGLIAWQSKPKRAKKLFADDLTSWRYETGIAENDLANKQHEWAATQEPTMAEARSVA
ncbi:MAG: hypothetical protein Q8M65_12025, partial [Rhodoglobus sp.]|nr:hypothetical protein [Rhodoglobus sp.]